MKRFLTAMALAVGVLSASADTDLVVAGGAGQQKFSISDVGKITFSESSMDVYGKDARQIGSFSLSEIAKVFFSDQADGVAQINPDNALEFSMQGNVVSVANLPSPADAYIVASDGRVAMSRQQWDGSSLNVGHLQAGVYVLVVDRAAFKFIKQQ